MPLKTVEAAHTAEVHALATHGTTRLLSASADASIKVWALPQLAPLYSLRARGRVDAPLAHDGAVYALAVVAPTQPEAAPRLFSASADRLIKAWDLRTMEQLATLAGHQSYVCALHALSCRRLLSASSDKTLAVWDLATYARLRVLTGHRGGLYSLTAHRGCPCSGSLDATVRVWAREEEVEERG